MKYYIYYNFECNIIKKKSYLNISCCVFTATENENDE